MGRQYVRRRRQLAQADRARARARQDPGRALLQRRLAGQALSVALRAGGYVSTRSTDRQVFATSRSS